MHTPQSRRSFLKQSGLGLAVTSAGLILPGCATRTGPTASNRVNIALIGCGGQMNGLQTNLLQIPEARIIATVDPFESRRVAAAQRANENYGGEYCQAVEDFREVLANPDIDGIVVATPDHWHVPIAIAAARAGKDMYVEKPLGLSLPRAAVLRRELKRKRCIFQYGTQQHSSLSGRQAVELVQNGFVGKITHCEAWSPALEPDARGPIENQPIPADLNYDLWLGPAPEAPYSNSRVTNAQGGWHCYDYALGFIAGWGAHPLDMLQWGIGKEHTAPIAYEGTGFLPEDAALLNTLRTWDIQMEYADGMQVRFRDGLSAEPAIREFHRYYKENGVIYHGTEGFVCHSRGTAYVNRRGKYVRIADINFDEFPIKAIPSPGHMQNFIDSMRSRKLPVSPIDPAINSDAISHLSNAAARTGKKIIYDPQSLAITSDPSLNAMLTRPLRAPYGI